MLNYAKIGEEFALLLVNGGADEINADLGDNVVLSDLLDSLGLEFAKPTIVENLSDIESAFIETLEKNGYVNAYSSIYILKD